MDLMRFLRRTGMTQRELALKMGCSSGLVGAWSSGSGVPSYEKIIKLLLVGMSIEEMFGKDIAEKTQVFSEQTKELPSTTDHDRFVAGVKEALAELAKAPKLPGMKE